MNKMKTMLKESGFEKWEAGELQMRLQDIHYSRVSRLLSRGFSIAGGETACGLKRQQQNNSNHTRNEFFFCQKNIWNSDTAVTLVIKKKIEDVIKQKLIRIHTKINPTKKAKYLN